MRVTVYFLLGTLFYLNFIHQINARRNGGCRFVEFGESTLRAGAKLRENLINIFGYLEKQDASRVPGTILRYFHELKHNFKHHKIDVFRLLPVIQQLAGKRLPDQFFHIINVIDGINAVEECTWRCKLNGFHNNTALLDILNLVPNGALLHGIPLGQQDLSTLAKVNTALLRPAPSNNYDIFKPSVMNIFREIIKSRSCFTENFFGYLLPFYPWERHDIELNMELIKVERYFQSDNADFISCQIYVADLYRMMNNPSKILDYILYKMEVTRCVPYLTQSVEKLIESRQNTKKKNVGEVQEFQNLIKLLDVITSENYPLEILFARDRVIRYLRKALPFMDKLDFTGHFYDLPQQQLLAFLDYILQVRPHIITDVRLSIKAIQAHLLFQMGPKRVDYSLLSIIIDAWNAPDLREDIKADTKRIKETITLEAESLIAVVKASPPSSCTGVVNCYIQILNVLEKHPNFHGKLRQLRPPYCIVNPALFCYDSREEVRKIEFADLLEQVNFNKYPYKVVAAAQDIITHIRTKELHIDAVATASACTQEETLLQNLQILMNNPLLLNVLDAIKYLIPAITKEIKNPGSTILKTKTLSPEMPRVPGNLEIMDTQSLLKVIDAINSAPSKELDAAKAYVLQHEQQLNKVLKMINCSRVDALNCFNMIQKKLLWLNDTELDMNVVSFLASPTVCDKKVCLWKAYEERGSDRLNPAYSYIKDLLENYRKNVDNYQIKLDIDRVLSLMQREDLKMILDSLDFKDVNALVNFLTMLESLPGLVDCDKISIRNIIRYITAKRPPTILTICSLLQIENELETLATNSMAVTGLQQAKQNILINQEKMARSLSMIAVDCKTFESCVNSLIFESLAENSKAPTKFIREVIQPPECNTENCPWILNATRSADVMTKILYAANNILQSPNTPLSVTMQMNRVLAFLKASETLNTITTATLSQPNPLKAVLETVYSQEGKISKTIKEDIQSVLNYINKKEIPQKIVMEDFYELLRQFDVATKTISVTEATDKLMLLIEGNTQNYRKIIEGMKIECNELKQCLDTIYSTIVTLPETKAKNHIIEVLKLEYEHFQISKSAQQMYTMRKIKELVEELPPDKVPFLVEVTKNHVIKFLNSTNMDRVLVEVMNSKADNLVHFLSKVKENVNTPPQTVQMIEDLLAYMTHKVQPNKVYLPLLLEIVDELKKMTRSTQVQKELENSKRLILENEREVSKVLSGIVAACSTINTCYKLIMNNLEQDHSTTSEMIKNSLSPQSCDKTKCAWTQVDMNQKAQQMMSKVLSEMNRMITNPKTNFLIKLDLEEIKKALRYGDVLPILIQLLNSGSQDALLVFLESLPDKLKEKYGISTNVQNIIDYIRSGKLPIHLSKNTLKSLASILMNQTSDMKVIRDIAERKEVLEEIIGVNKVLKQLNVSCNTLNNCVQSLLKTIELSKSSNKVTRVIESMIRVPNCQPATCKWLLKNETGHAIQAVKDLRKELILATQGAQVPLIIKMYGEKILPYFSINELSSFLKGKMTLEEALLAMSQDDKLDIRIRDIALAIYNYLTTGELPSTLTSDDIQTLTEHMLSKTTDVAVQEEIKQQSDVLLKRYEELDSLLRLCKIKCVQLKSCILQLKTCAERSHHDISSEVLKYVLPPNCNIHVCSWLPQENGVSTKHTLSLIPEVLNSIKKMVVNSEIPFQFKLDIAQIANVIKMADFAKFIKEEENHMICIMKGSLSSTNQVVNPKYLKNLNIKPLMQLLESIPITTFYKFGIFHNVNNIVDFFLRGIVPKYFDVNTFKYLGQVLAKRSKDARVSEYILKQVKALDLIPYLEGALNQIPVNCKTLKLCIASILKSIETAPIPLYLHSVIADIIQPSVCNRAVCDWVTFDSTPRLVQIAAKIRTDIHTMTSNQEAPLIIKLHGQQILRYLNFYNLYSYISRGPASTQNFLLQMSLDVNNSPRIRYMCNMIVYYLNGGEIPKKITHHDFVPLTREILDSTLDVLVKQQIIGYANRLYKHADDLDTLLIRCSITCTTLKICISQIATCNEQHRNFTISQILWLYVRPPLCNFDTCPWMPKQLAPLGVTMPLNETSPDFCLFIIPDENKLKPVLLDLNDRTVKMTLLKLTNTLGVNDRPLIIKLKLDRHMTKHIYLDLTHPLVAKTLLGLNAGRTEFLNAKTMKTFTVMLPTRNGQLTGVTFDMTDKRTRQRLVAKAKAQTVVNPYLPTITFIDLDGEQYRLTLDVWDTDTMETFLSYSINNLNDDDDNVVVFYLAENGSWNTINLGTLDIEAKSRLQNLPSYHAVGIPTNYILTSCSLISLDFDAYDQHVVHELERVDMGKVPVIDVDKEKSITLVVPSDYGRLEAVRVDLKNKHIIELQKISQTPFVNRGRPSLILKREDETIPIYLNPEDSRFKDFIYSIMSSTIKKNRPEDKITEIIKKSENELFELIQNTEVPFNVKLSLKQIAKMFQTGELNRDIIASMQSVSDSLFTVLQSQNTTNSLVKLLDTLPQDILLQYNIFENVRDVSNYLRGFPVQDRLLENTFQELTQILMEQTADRNVILDMKVNAEMLSRLPDFGKILQELPVKCEVLKTCLQSLLQAIEYSNVDSSVKSILLDVVAPNKCTNTTCKWIPTVTHVKEEVELPPESKIAEEDVHALETIIAGTVTAIKTLLNDSKIPYHVKLSMAAIKEVFEKNGILKKLLTEIESMPPEYRKQLLESLKNIAVQITNKNLSPQEIFEIILKNVPEKFLLKTNIEQSAQNVLNYLGKGIIPGTLDIATLEQLVKSISVKIEDQEAKVFINKQLDTIIRTQDVENKLNTLPVQCTTLKSCVESISRSLEFSSSEDHMNKVLQSILRPPVCSRKTCSILEIVQDDTKALAVFSLDNGKDRVVLDLKNESVSTVLLALSEKQKPAYPSIVMSLTVAGKKQLVSLDFNDFTTINVLKKLEQETMSKTEAVRVTHENESLIIGVAQDNTGQLVSFVIKDDAKTYQTVQKYHSPEEKSPIKIPFSQGEIYLTQENINKISTIQIHGDATHLPSNVNVQPPIIPLPNKEQIKITYDYLKSHLKMTGESDMRKLTKIPVAGPDGTVTFISVDLHDKETLTILEESSKNVLYVPPEDTVLVIVQHDDFGDQEIFVLDLNNEVVSSALAKISEKVDHHSDKLTTVNFIDTNGNVQTITMDMNKLPVQELKLLSEETSITLKPVLVTDTFGSELVSIIVKDQAGQTHPVVLNVTDEDVRMKLIKLSDATNAHAVPVEIRGADGIKFVVYLDTKDKNTVMTLDELAKSTGNTNGILLNKNDQKDTLFYIKVNDLGGTLTLKLNTSNGNILKSVKRLEELSPPNSPTYTVTDSEGKSHFIRLDTENPQVSKELKSIADTVVKEYQSHLQLKPAEELAPLVIDLSHPQVVSALINLSMKTQSLTGPADVIVVQDAKGNPTIIKLHLEDKTVYGMLKKMLQKTSQYLKSMEIEGSTAGSTITLVPLTEGSKVKFVMLNGSNTNVIRKLESISDIFNPKAIEVVLHEESGKKVVVHLDLKDVRVKQILEKMNEEFLHYSLKPTSSPTGEIVEIPVITTTGEIVLKCNISETEVMNSMLRWGYTKASVRANNFAIDIVDKFLQHHRINIDISNPLIIRKLRQICTVPPKPDDLIVISHHDQANGTLSIVVNTKDKKTQRTLEQLANMTHTGTNATMIQYQDEDSLTHTVYLDLENENVINSLQTINQKVEHPILVNDETGRKTLLALTVDDESGNKKTIILDTRDKATLETLLSHSDKANPNSIAIDVDTPGGRKKLYLDLKNPKISNNLTKVSRKRIPKKPVTINPNVQTETIISLAVLGVNNHPVVITLDLSKESVKKIIRQADIVESDKTRPIVIMENGSAKMYNIPTNNNELTEALIKVSTKYEYMMEEGSLLLAPIVMKPGETKFVLLDMKNDQVVEQLLSLSNNMGKDVNATSITFVDKLGHFQYCNIDLDNRVTQDSLSGLSRLTPPNVKVQEIANPYGPNPIVVGTYVNPETGETTAIVIDTNNANNIRQLHSVKDTTENPVMPLVINYVDQNNVQRTLVLDLNDRRTRTVLDSISRPPQNYPKEVLRNHQTLSTAIDSKVQVVIQDDSRHDVSYTLDLNEAEIFNELINIAAPPNVQSTIIYVKNPEGGVTPIRINLKDKKVQSKIAKLSTNSIVSMASDSVLLLTVLNDEYKAEAIVLDMNNAEVLQSLKELSSSTPQGVPVSAVTFTDNNGKKVPIRIDVKNPAIIQKLKELQKRTPKNIYPVRIDSLLGPQPLIVFTTNEGGSVLPIVLNPNNPNVVEQLKLLSQPDDANAFAIEIVDRLGKMHKVYINPNKPYVRQMLKQLCDLLPFIPGPVTKPTDEPVVIHIEDIDGKPLEIVLDVSDKSVIENLIQLSAIASDIGSNVLFNVLDKTGRIMPIKLDVRNPKVINALKSLAKRHLTPAPHTILPNYQRVALLSFSIASVDGHVYPITLDLNNQDVLNEIRQLNATYHPVVMIKYTGPDGTQQIIRLDNDDNTIRRLNRLAKLCPVSVSPIEVILPQKTKSLVSLLIPQKNYALAVTIDSNSEEAYELLASLQTGRGRRVIGIEFDLKTGKRLVNIDLDNQSTIDMLKVLTKKNKIFIIPVSGSYPILAIRLDSGELIKIDTNSAEAIQTLIEMSKHPDNNRFPLTEINLKNEDGITIPIKIALNNPAIYDKLKELGKRAPLPSVTITKPKTMPELNVCPITVLPPGGSIYPLLSLVTKDGIITLDLNNRLVFEEIAKLSQSTPDDDNKVLITVPDAEGNQLQIKLNLRNRNVLDRLRQLAKRCPIQFDNKEPLPSLAIDLPDKNGQKHTVHLDFTDPTVLNTLTDLDSRYEYQNPYKIQIPTRNNTKIVLSIDFNDQRVLERISDLFSKNKQPYYVTFDIPDLLGNIWKVVLDLENRDVMRQLMERSDMTGDSPGASKLELDMPDGSKKVVNVNLHDPNSINLLKYLTKLSTGRDCALIDSKKPKAFFEFTFSDRNGKPMKITLDANNASVMKKLKQLSAWFNAKVPSIIDVQQPHGKPLQLKFDLTDDRTIQNLKNLQDESLGAKGVPLLPLDSRGGPHKPKMVISFDINTPYQPATIVFDLYIPGMIEKLKALNNAFKLGGQETRVAIDNKKGVKFDLRLDLADKETIRTLGRLTQESTGANPIKEPLVDQRGSETLPDLVTIEIPIGVENIPISINKNDDVTVQTLLKLNNVRAPQPAGFKIIDKANNNKEKDIILDTANRKVLSTLQTIGVPSVYPAVAPAVSMFTLIFLPSGNNRFLPILVDLGDKRNVVNMVKISYQNQKSMYKPSYLEVRDETGQYLRIPIDLTHPNVISDLTKTWNITRNVQIDAKMLPYLTLAIPQRGNAHQVVKFQLKPKTINSIFQNLNSTNPYGLPIQIFDVNRKLQRYTLDITKPDLIPRILAVDNAVLIEPPQPRNLFIIMRIDEKNETDPLYLNLDETQTTTALRKIKYDPYLPLTLVQYYENEQYEYLLIDIVNPANVESLSEFSSFVDGHAIIKQNVVHTALLSVPSPSGTGTITITLDIANRDILRELRSISRSFKPGGTKTVVSLEDAYGFPLELTIDYTDKITMSRLMALNNKQSR